MNKKYLIVAALICSHIFLLTKLKFTAWPEMLLWPDLILQGFIPYKHIAMAHTPLLIFDLAVFFKAFGAGIIQLKIFTWILIILTDFIVFKISDKLYGKKTALISTAAYVLMQIFFDGNGLWFDLVLAPIALIFYYLLSKKQYFWSGVVFMAMFLTKQTAFWFLIPFSYHVYLNLRSKPEIIKRFLYGALFVALIFVAGITLWGSVIDFWTWAIKFGIFILPVSQGQIQFPSLRPLVLSLFPFSILVVYLFTKKKTWVNLFLWILAGGLGAYPRFEYFHFQPALPFLAIAIGIAFSKIKPGRLFTIYTPLYLLGFFYLFSAFIIRNLNEGVRFYEPNVVAVSGYIKENTTPGQRIFVLNWWDSIYSLSGTLPATVPLVPQLSWYQEIPGIQDTEVAGLAYNKPQFVVLNPYSSSGLAAYKPGKVYEYILTNYHVADIIDGIEILVPNEI